MAFSGSVSARRQIPTVDISPFTTDDTLPVTQEERLRAGRDLAEACHRLGFVKIVGHGVSVKEIEDALAWAKELFDLPLAEKMKAPHPPGNMPHRGYSGIGLEKVYGKADVEQQSAKGDIGKELRKISDFKESYEIGSEDDDQQQNIWLPEDVLPRFREYMTTLYGRLAGVGQIVLEALGVGLGLDEGDHIALMAMKSDRHCQLRLLHYPEIRKEKVKSDLITRLPAHTDWGTFTMLFQDDRGGLELRDPQSHAFLHAEPQEGALLLNIGDMLQRFTNDYFVSALHRVAIPDLDSTPESRIPARYSIPFFVAPAPTHTISTSPNFVTTEGPAKYEAVKFEDYGAIVSKYMYQDG